MNARASCYDDGQPRVERAVGDDAQGNFHGGRARLILNINYSPKTEAGLLPDGVARNLLPRACPPSASAPQILTPAVLDDVAFRAFETGIMERK